MSKLWMFHKSQSAFSNHLGPQNFTAFREVNTGLKIVKISENNGNYLIVDNQGKLFSIGTSN
jgi:hypothetical protein